MSFVNTCWIMTLSKDTNVFFQNLESLEYSRLSPSIKGMSDFHSEDEKCCSSFPAEAVAEGKILYGPNVSVLLLLHVV